MNYIIRQNEKEKHFESLLSNFEIFFENLPDDYKPNQALLERTMTNTGAIFSADIILFAIEDYNNNKLTILNRQGCIDLRTLVDFYLNSFPTSNFVSFKDLNGKKFSDLEHRFQRKIKEKRITLIEIDSHLTPEELEVVKKLYSE